MLGSFEEELPPAFREEFLLPDDGAYRVLLDGTMEVVWSRPRWLRPLLALLAQSATLFPETGHDVPTTMLVSAVRDATGHVHHTWERTFAFPGRTRRIDAELAWNGTHVAERMGPRRALELAWHVAFAPPASIHIAARLQSVRIRGRRLRLPRWLTVEAWTVDTADPARTDTLRCELTVRHPWLGPIFGYSGTFRLRRV
jgi:Domain of unknown function (DUF4166)